LLTAGESNKKTRLYGNPRPDHKLLDVSVPVCGGMKERNSTSRYLQHIMLGKKGRLTQIQT
jgi:hypothetical protein